MQISKNLHKQKKLSQFFTPVWAAEILFTQHFSHLTEKDLVWEPSCGEGSFLSSIPKHISAIGSDIDPELVPVAEKNTGRPVYHGDFRSIKFNRFEEITAIIGNPPFDLDVFEQFMQRCENILAIGNKAGFILPAYFLQTSRTFRRLTQKWDIDQKMIPRDLFKSLSKPLVWASFIRDNNPQLFSFLLYKELIEVKDLSPEIKNILDNNIKRTGSVWREVLISVVKDSGGTVTLDQVYKHLENKKPTSNPFWKEQVRKLIQQTPFQRVDKATYKLVA